jgi:hypothetical protein
MTRRARAGTLHRGKRFCGAVASIAAISSGEAK